MLVLALAVCGRSDPEKELRTTVAAMAQAVESRRVGDALAPLAEDFTRESGAFDKTDARRVLAGAMMCNEKARRRRLPAPAHARRHARRRCARRSPWR
jgi:hypothetical protein